MEPLQWSTTTPHVHQALKVVKTKVPARKYPVHTLFAMVRPARAGDGLLAEHLGWVVTMSSFEDIKHFATLEEAKLHVEAVYALSQ
jgi:hypothetical protein